MFSLVPVFTWWLTIQLFGLAALPLTGWVFRWLPDRGYAFSKAVGLLVVSYLLWLGASAGILINDLGGITFALLLLAGLSAWAGLSRAPAGENPLRYAREQIITFWRCERRHILMVEALFLLAFAGWVVVRAYAPDKIMQFYGEKYMEIAFLNGVLNSPRFPPLDPWLSGFGISYYYFGYVMMAVVTRLSGVLPEVGFDLYDALTFALAAACAYGVVSNLVRLAGGSRRAAGGTGLLGALFVVGLGNLEGLVHGLNSARLLPEEFIRWLAIPGLASEAQSGSFYPGHGWWWWTASRVLNDVNLNGQPVLEPITEFPFFSFLLGDNHPHKLALPFVLLAAGLALNLLLRERAGERVTRADAGRFAFYALALGGLAFLNTWDFPIYTGLTLLAFAAGRYLAGSRLDLRLLGQAALLAVGLGAASVLLYLLFYTSFSSQAAGILPYIFPPTRLPQYLVMFGPQIIILAVFLPLALHAAAGNGFPLRAAARSWLWIAGISAGFFLFLLLAAAAAVYLLPPGSPAGNILAQNLGEMSTGELLGQILWGKLSSPWLFLTLSALLALALTAALQLRGESAARRHAPATMFALLMAFTGIILTLSVEFFYLRDAFGLRMNTVFKFYYQGWVLMSCAAAYAVWWVTRSALQGPSQRFSRAAFSTAAALLAAAGLVYPVMGVYSRTAGFSGPPNMSAAANIAGTVPGTFGAMVSLPGDWKAVEWLRENADTSNGPPVILEAPPPNPYDSYKQQGRISAFTGFPTLLGWGGHEGQWRGNIDEPLARYPDIRTIFTTHDGGEALDLLQKWQVDYVIIGQLEREYIQQACKAQEASCDPLQALEKFDAVLPAVYAQDGVTIYIVPE